MTFMFKPGRNVFYRDAGLGCLGTYRSVRIAIGPLYISFGFRVSK